MAATGEKKKKRNFVQRMMFGNENKPDLTPERMNMSKWAIFKYLLFNRFGTMSAINMLTALFALPGVAVIVLFYMNISISNGFIPYSSNLGIGYPVVIDAVAQGEVVEFTYRMLEYLLLVPCIAVLALGVSGNLYVIRKLIWEEPTSTFKDFFRGIKKCWLGSLLMGVVFGLVLMSFLYSLSYFDIYGYPVWVKALCITITSILLVFITLFGAFFLTQNAAFKMRPMVLIRNSALFVFGMHIMALIMVGIAVAPAFLSFIPNFTIMLVIIYVFIGFSFTTLVISVFCHYCYERFLYDKIDAPSTSYVKRKNDFKEDNASAKNPNRQKKSATPYKNPKKRKKSIDEGASLTPLTPMFKREDLERLQMEHEKIIAESQDDEADNDEDVEDTPSDLNDVNVSDTPVENTEKTAAEGDGADPATGNE